MSDTAFRTPALDSLHRPAGEGRAERVLETLHLYKVEAAETGGMFSCFEVWFVGFQHSLTLPTIPMTYTLLTP